MYVIHLYTTSGEHWYSFHAKRKDARSEIVNHLSDEYTDCTNNQPLADQMSRDNKQYIILESVGDSYYVGA